MRFIKSKKGMEVTIGFLVKLIMAIVMFSFAIWFARSMFSTGDQITDKAFNDWDKQVSGLSCSPGQKVCIPRTTKETETEDGVVFGLVIKNVFDEEREFRYYVHGGPQGPTTFVDATGANAISKLNANGDKYHYMPVPPDGRKITLKAGEQSSLGIVVQHIGPTKGTAAFTVKVEVSATSDSGTVNQGWINYGIFKVYLRSI